MSENDEKPFAGYGIESAGDWSSGYQIVGGAGGVGTQYGPYAGGGGGGGPSAGASGSYWMPPSRPAACGGGGTPSDFDGRWTIEPMDNAHGLKITLRLRRGESYSIVIPAPPSALNTNYWERDE